MHGQLHDPFATDGGIYVPTRNAYGEPFNYSNPAHPWLTDQHRSIFCFLVERAHQGENFLFPSDNGINLPGPRLPRDVIPILVKIRSRWCRLMLCHMVWACGQLVHRTPSISLAVMQRYQGSLYCRAQRFDIHADLSDYTGNERSRLLQDGGKQVQTMDLGSSSRLGNGFGTLKRRF